MTRRRKQSDMTLQRPYSATEEEKTRYAGVYLLWRLINDQEPLSAYLEGDNAFLESLTTELYVKEYMEISDDGQYVPTESGRMLVVRFMERYTDFLKVYDLYHSVDLGAGEFAVVSYFDFDHDGDDREWRIFLDDERWEDLRVAVAEYKGINPVEIVLMSSINEGRFGKDSKSGWQFDLLLGTVWDSILDVCNTNLSWQDLGPEDVIQDIITQGTELMLSLLQEEENRVRDAAAIASYEDNGRGGDLEDTIVVEEVVPVVDYGYYRTWYVDPFYCAPFWYDPWYW